MNETETGHIILGITAGVTCIALVAHILPFLALGILIDTLVEKPEEPIPN